MHQENLEDINKSKASAILLEAEVGDDAQTQSCRDLLQLIKERKIEVPALIFLELNRPLVGIADALIVFAQPFLQAFSVQHTILEVFRNRSNIDWLIKELDKSSRPKAK